MNKIIKSVSAILVISLLASLSCFGIFVSAENTDSLNTQAIEKMTALGIWDSSYQPDGVVKRGDFANILCKIIDRVEIEALREVGVFEKDSLLRLDDDIEYAEMVKMLVCLLGYQHYTDKALSYPQGYLAIAGQYGIIEKGTGKGEEDQMTFAEVADVLDIALDVDVVTSYLSGGNTLYSVKQGETLLGLYRNIYYYDGVLSSADGYSISKKATAGSGLALVGGEYFYTDGIDAYDLLGYNVRAYYKASKTKSVYDTLVYIDSYSYKNEAIEVDNEDIAEVGAGYISYWVNGDKTKKLNFDDQTEITENNMPAVFSERAILNADKLVYIDSDRDGIAEVIKLINGEIVVAERIDYENSKVYAKYTGQIVDLSGTEGEKITFVTDDGAPAQLEQVVSYSVLTVYRAGKNIKIVISNKTFSGTVEEIESVGLLTDYKLTINGEVYKFAKNADDIEEASRITVGAAYDFYLDCMGKIAAVSSVRSSDLTYGYVVNAGFDTELSDTLKVKLFTLNNKFEIFECAPNVKVDGRQITNNRDVFTALKTSDSNVAQDSVVRRIIRYKLNDNGQIYSIDTPKISTEEAKKGCGLKDYDEECLTEYKTLGTIETSFRYDWETRILEASVRLDSDTKTFYVPSNEEFFNDIDHYKIANLAYVSGAKTCNTLKAYDVTKDRRVGCLVVETNGQGGQAVNDDTGIIVVKEVKQVLNDEGDVVYAIIGMSWRNQVKIYLEDGFDGSKEFYDESDPSGVFVSHLGFGDVIRPAYNVNGEMCDYDKIFSFGHTDKLNVVQRGKEVKYPETTCGDYASLVYVNPDCEYPPLTNSLTGARDYSDFNGRMFYKTGSRWYFPHTAFQAAYGIVQERIGGVLLVSGYTNSEDGAYTDVLDLTDNKTVVMIDGETETLSVASYNDIVSVRDAGEDEATRILFIKFDGKVDEVIILKGRGLTE